MKLSQRVAHERLSRLCFIDYDREMALVADRKDPQTGEHEIIAVARLIKQHGSSGQEGNDAEFALIISDQFQRAGLGTELLRRLLQFGRDEGVRRVTADILADNRGMQRVCAKLGFHFRNAPDDGVSAAAIDLTRQGPA